MKQFMSRVRDLSQRAAEIKAAMERVPPKVAEIREAVSATAGQLQQLKSQIDYSVADLRANDENHLSEALQEIAGSEDVLLEAGFGLDGVDLEISPVQRLLVHLSRLEDVSDSALRKLASANQHRRSVHAILSALLQAQQMAATVNLANLTYCEVIIGVGPIPSVRLCWRPEELPMPVAEALSNAAKPAPLPGATTAAPAPTALPAPQSAFGPGSFFEKRAAATPAAQAAQPVEPSATEVSTTAANTAPAPVAATAEAPVEVASPTASLDPLARFKKMPNLSVHKK